MEDNVKKAENRLDKVLRVNHIDKSLNSVFMMKKLFDNVVENPDEEKYRRINCNKEKVSSNLTDVAGMQQVLECVDWVYDKENNWYNYDAKKDPQDLKKMSEF